MKIPKKTYTFTLEQIRQGDGSDFLARFDPARLSPPELAGLCGALRVRIEQPRAWSALFTDLRSRQFFRELHSRFPFWGFFLRLHPVRGRKRSPALLDAELFVAIGFCQADVMAVRWDRLGQQALLIQNQQFEAFLAEVDGRLAELGQRAGLSGPAIAHRRKVVAQTARSFLRLCRLTTCTPPP